MFFSSSSNNDDKKDLMPEMNESSSLLGSSFAPPPYTIVSTASIPSPTEPFTDKSYYEPTPSTSSSNATPIYPSLPPPSPQVHRCYSTLPPPAVHSPSRSTAKADRRARCRFFWSLILAVLVLSLVRHAVHYGTRDLRSHAHQALRKGHQLAGEVGRKEEQWKKEYGPGAEEAWKKGKKVGMEVGREVERDAKSFWEWLGTVWMKLVGWEKEHHVKERVGEGLEKVGRGIEKVGSSVANSDRTATSVSAPEATLLAALD